MKKRIVFIVLLLILGAVVWFGYDYLYRQTVTFVTIDINPSVELSVNRSDQVVEVIPLNEDADIITSNLDLEGKKVEEASTEIIDAATEAGYIDELSEDNTVTISTSTENEDEREALEEKIKDELNDHFDEVKVFPLLLAGVTDAIKSEADKYDISNGKMMLVNRLIALDNTLVKDDVVKLSIKEIQKKIQAIVDARHDALKLNVQEIKEKWQEKMEEKVEATEQKIETAKETLWNQYKEEYKNATSTEKKEIINNLIKEKKEQIKEKINNMKNKK